MGSNENSGLAPGPGRARPSDSESEILPLVVNILFVGLEIDFLLIIAIIMTGLLLVGSLRKRTSNICLKLALWVTSLLIPNIISYSLGIMKDNHGSEKHSSEFYVIWSVFLVTVLEGCGSVSAFKLEDNENGVSAFADMFLHSYMIGVIITRNEHVVMLWAPLLILTMLMLARVHERVESLISASKINSYTGVANVVRKNHDYVKSDVEKSSHEPEDYDPITMRGYRNLVGMRFLLKKMGIQPAPPCYHYCFDECENDIVTVEKVWQCRDDLLERNEGRLKDSCLAFSLFWTILRRYADYPLLEFSSPLLRLKAWKFIREGLIRDDSPLPLPSNMILSSSAQPPHLDPISPTSHTSAPSLHPDPMSPLNTSTPPPHSNPISPFLHTSPPLPHSDPISLLHTSPPSAHPNLDPTSPLHASPLPPHSGPISLIHTSPLLQHSDPISLLHTSLPPPQLDPISPFHTPPPLQHSDQISPLHTSPPPPDPNPDTISPFHTSPPPPHSDPLSPSPSEVTCERVFRVIEEELGFLFDYFYTKNYIFYLNGKRSVVARLVVVVIYIGIAVVLVVKNCSASQNNHTFNKADIVVTTIVMWATILSEFTQIIFIFLNQWFVITCVCTYIQKNKIMSTRRDVWLKWATEHLCNLKDRLRPKRWKRKLSQYSLISSYNHSPIHHLPLIKSGFYIFAGLGLREDDPVELSSALKAAVVKYLLGYPTHGGTCRLTNGISSLEKHNVTCDFSWACHLETDAQTILVWHIATTLCELDPRNRGRTDDHFLVATILSKYCAYLVGFAPELLPDHPNITAVMLDNVVGQAKCTLGKHATTDEKYQKMQKIELNDTTDHILHKGIRLGRSLAEYNGTPKSWEILADFWVELLLYLAPSNNVTAHIRHLADGGEFITHIWTLLTHAGILDREPTQAHVNP